MKPALQGLYALAALGVCGASWATADFSGVWQAVDAPAALRTEQGALPPLLPQARQSYEAHLAARKAGDASFDPTTQCQPPGTPRAYFMGMPFEIQQEQKDIYILFQWNRLFRVVDLGISHDQQNMYAPTFFGWSVGSWQQDELVIDSVLFNDSTLLDAAGLPHSMDLHTIERWRLSRDGQRIDARITIEDPASYAQPWSFRASFRRLPKGTEIQEDVCLERLGLVPAH
ncbi:MAG: hypothetical protein QM718_05125 [Steroidobacteraceae bacterium]